MLHLIVRCSAELLGIAVDCFAIADDNFRHYRHCEHWRQWWQKRRLLSTRYEYQYRRIRGISQSFAPINLS